MFKEYYPFYLLLMLLSFEILYWTNKINNQECQKMAGKMTLSSSIRKELDLMD